jgi:methylthioribose-1-phosphate isomerase
MAECIKNMKIRGAQAIGAAAALGLALAAIECKKKEAKEFLDFLKEAASLLKSTRPTAVNLFWAVDRVLGAAIGNSTAEIRRNIIKEVEQIIKEEVECNLRIGKHGSTLIENGMQIQTHCNAGSLATIWYGTALAPIYRSWQEGKRISVIVDETRPRLQGARLTAWELKRVGIPFLIVSDSASGYLMSKGLVDLVIVGADRIASNGDVANKIGTYPLALVAKEHGVPFYVAASSSTIDFSLKSSEDIPIEERSADEVLFVGEKLIPPRGSKALNPAFDVTPAKYIRGIITEFGMFKPRQISKIKRYKA